MQGVPAIAGGLTVAWTAGGMFLYLAAPMVAPVVLMLSLVAPLAWLGSRAFALKPFEASPLAMLLAVIALYLFASAAWSPTGGAWRGAAMVLIVAIVLPLVLAAQRELGRGPLRCMAQGIAIGYAAGALLLGFEMVADFPLHRIVMARLPGVEATDRAAVQNWRVPLLPHFPNHELMALGLMLGPAWLSWRALPGSRLTAIAGCVALALVCACVLMSRHASTYAALIAGALMLALHGYAPRFTARGLMVGWIVACAGAVPLTYAAYANGLQTSRWLFPSAQHRVVIWGYTSRQVLEKPFLGHGVGAARSERAAALERGIAGAGTPFGFEPSLHSHNAYLQAWYEAGAVGAALLMALGLVILRAIRRAPEGARGLLFATFATCATMIAFSYSLWAAWMISSLALVAILAAPAVMLADCAAKPGQAGLEAA